MARLTRTQKYAEYRDKISQDREESLKTDGLSRYEDKLRQLESNFNNEPETNLNFRKEQTSFNQSAPIENPGLSEQVKQAQEESMKSLDDILSAMMESSDSIYKPQPVQEEVKPVVEVEPTPVEIPTPVVEKAIEEEPIDIMSTMDIITNEVDELSNIINEQKVEAPVPVVSAPVSKPVVKAEPTPVEKKAPVVETANANFINDTFKEVDDYNRNEGRTTLDKLPESMVEEVRHPQTPVVEQIRTEETKADNDFSNTVTLEIEKVLREINGQNEENETVKVEEPVVEQAVEQIVEAELETENAFENAEVNNETMEHPVLAKTVEEPVVEIKNINEAIDNSTADTNVLDDTIPFVVDRQEEDEEYEVEEDAPNKALNVILGILIFVLIAVLGVIVYYILVAKGIIG